MNHKQRAAMNGLMTTDYYWISNVLMDNEYLTEPWERKRCKVMMTEAVRWARKQEVKPVKTRIKKL